MTAFSSAKSRHDFFLQQLDDYVTAWVAGYIGWNLKSFSIPLNHWYKAQQELETLWLGLEG